MSNAAIVFVLFALVSVCIAVNPTQQTYQKSASNGAVLLPQTANVWLKPKAAGGTDFTKTITVKITPKSQTQLDVFLLEDLSGSFYNDLPNLRAMVRSLTSNLRSEYKDAWFGLGSYIDIPISPFGSSSRGDYVYRTHIPMTASTSALQNAVNAMSTRSGGDYPESQIFALQQVAKRATSECGFRSGSRRVVVLSTDATYHDNGDGSRYGLSGNNGNGVVGSREDYPSVAQVRQALLDANIVPIFAVTSGVVSSYRTLVSQLGFGAVTTLSSTSSNLISAIKAGLDSVRTAVVANVISDPQRFVTQNPSPASQHAASYETQRTFSIKLGYQNKGTKSDSQVKVSVQGFGIITFNVDVNQKPTVTATSTVQTNEGQDVRVTVGGTDPDGNSLSYRLSRMPTKGEVFQNNGGAVGAKITSTGTYFTTNSFWYRPAAFQSGSPYTYLYVRSYDSQTSNVQLSSNERSIRVNVIPKPDPPVGTTGTQTVNEDSNVVITLTGTDPEGFTAFTAQIKVLPSRGTLRQMNGAVISSVGTTVTDSQRRVRYYPPANANGNNYASFGYILRDNQGLWSVVKTVPINVTPVNDPPVAVIAANPLTVREQVDFFIALNAYDIDDNSHTYTIVSAPTKGKMYQCTGTTTKSATQITGSNTAVTFKQGNTAYVAYNSDSNEFGNNYATFVFRVNDGQANSADLTVTINVQNTVDAPTATYTPSPAAFNEDTNLQTLVLTGTSIDSPLRSINQIQVLSLPAKGRLYQRNGNTRGAQITSVPATFSGSSKQLWYEPALNDNGNNNKFNFRVSDGVPSATATVTLQIAAVNDAPVAIAQTYAADEIVDTVFTLRGIDVDFPGQNPAPGSAVITTPLTGSKGRMYQYNGGVKGAQITTANTVLTDAGNRVIYNSFVTGGSASGLGFETFAFRWRDSGNPVMQSSPVTCSIDVADTNNPKPTVNAATGNGQEDAEVLVTLTGATQDGKPYHNAVITRMPTKGQIFQVTGGNARGTEITAVDTVITNSANFVAKVMYLPETNGNGNNFDTFGFKMSDNPGGGMDPNYSLQGIATINVAAVNDKPTASAETPVEMQEDATITIPLSGADIDGDSLTAYIFNINANGGQMRNSNGAGTVLTNNSVVASKNVYFAPPANAHSVDASTPYASFEFFMRDNSGVTATRDSDPVKVDIIVASVPDAPIPSFLPNPATINEEGNIVITLTGTSIDGSSSMSATVTQLPNNGKLYQATAGGQKSGNALTTAPIAITQNNGAGLGKKLVYEGDLDYFGSDTFKFVVNDGTPSALATASITINAVNDKPVASAPSPVTLLEDGSVTIELKGNDVDDTTLTYKITAVPAKGTLYNGPTTGGTVLTNGATVTDANHRVTFQPAANENSQPAGSTYTSFSFTVQDNAPLVSDPFQVNLIVEPVNDAPTSHPITVNTNEDSKVLINLPGFDIDAGETLTAVIDQMPTKGQLYQVNNDLSRGAPVNMSTNAVVVTNNNRTLWFEPEANMHGTPYTTFTYFVQDSAGVNTASQTCTINVASVQDPPFAFADSPLTGDEDAEIIIRLQGRDDDFPAGTQPNLNLTLTVLPSCLTVAPPTPRCSLAQSDGTPITGVPTIVTSSQGFLTFRPGRDQNGDNYASLQFTATDGIEVSAAATVDINVTPVNDLPTYNPVAFLVTPEDTPKVMTVVASDRDGPKNPPSLVVTRYPQHGDIHEYDSTQADGKGAKIVGTGTPARFALAAQRLVYVPHANYYGRDAFQWTVNDGTADAAQPWRTIVVVSGVNDAPVVTALKTEFTTTQGEQIALDNITAIDVDAGANPVQLTIENTIKEANLTMGSHSLSVISETDLVKTYQGSIAQVNDAVSRLFYALGNKGTKNVEDTITITVNDQGYSQSKRVPQGPALSDSATIKVTVEPKKEPFQPQEDNTAVIVAGAAAGVAGAAAAFKGLRHFGAAKDAEILDHDATPDAAFSDNPLHEGQGGWQGNIMYGRE